MSQAFDLLCQEEPWRKPRVKPPKVSDTDRRFQLLKARIVALRPFLPHPHYQASTGLIRIGQYHRFEDAEHITMLPVHRKGLPPTDVLNAPTIYQPTQTTKNSLFYYLDDYQKRGLAHPAMN